MAAHGRAAARATSATCRSTTPRELLGDTAARCYGFDVEALRPIADRIGPTPEDLGQDPASRRDPDEVRRARWWKAEYGIAT